MPPKAAIIILNWNGKKLLDISLPAALNLDYPNYEIWLVENGSADGSKEYLKEKYGHNQKLKILDLDKNYGFAEGNNLAIKQALKDPEVRYIACLNNDAKVEPNWLTEMIEVMEKDDQVGSVATKIKFFYEDNLIDSCGILVADDGGGMNRGFKEKDEGQYNKQTEIFGPSAGAALYRVKALKKLDLDAANYFTRQYFAYYEDVDLAWRLRLLDYKSIYTPKSTVLHVHSATAISHSPFKAFHIQRNRLITLVHIFPFWQMLYSLLIVTAIRYLHLANSALFKKSGPSYKLREKTSTGALILITLKAWGSFIKLLPMIIKQRRRIQKTKKISAREIRALLKKYPAPLEKMIYQ